MRTFSRAFMAPSSFLRSPLDYIGILPGGQKLAVVKLVHNSEAAITLCHSMAEVKRRTPARMRVAGRKFSPVCVSGGGFHMTVPPSLLNGYEGVPGGAADGGMTFWRLTGNRAAAGTIRAFGTGQGG
jgi:hypothetical protein